jgi:hypothetical protein
MNCPRHLGTIFDLSERAHELSKCAIIHDGGQLKHLGFEGESGMLNTGF